MFWKTFASVFGKRSLVRPFLEPFDFVLIRSTTSEMMPCTFSLSPSVLYKKLFTRKAAMYSLYLSETSSRTAVIFLHLWKTFRFLFIVPKSGLFFVSSIELHEELDELNGVDEQHGELRREESSKLATAQFEIENPYLKFLHFHFKGIYSGWSFGKQGNKLLRVLTDFAAKR